ncbi:MAG TPA: PKD domain-containing protein [Pyrinomonadaceae bacterium]|nr:PKD domain-containing protein [Pyrinomonadaceae bacterium]
MTRKPNFAKFMLGLFVVAVLFIGTWATTRAPLTSAKRTTASTTEVAASTNSTAALNLSAPLTPPLVPITSVFELDGNIKKDGTIDDWGNINCPNPQPGSGGNSLAHTGVLVDGLGQTIFTGGGSKDDHDVTDWKWKNGSVPPKDEILNTYAAKYAPNILVFGAERITTQGSAFIGVWFFKQNVVPIGTPTAGFSGAHEAGDVLVLNEFDSGGAATQSKVFKWITAASQCTGVGEFLEGTNLCDITNSAPPGSVLSTTNSVPLTLANEGWCWTYTNSSGGTTMDSQAFFEGAIDLDAFPALAGACFSSFQIETRSSFETNSQLKDFAGGSFNTCVDVTLTKTATDVCEGSATTYTYTVTNSGAIDANFTLTDDNETGPYTEPFAASQIQADDIDVGADNNCATQVGAGSPTSFMIAAGQQKVFQCTIAQVAGTHNNTAQTTASFGASTKSDVASATAKVFVNPVAAAGADQSVCKSTASHQFSLNATAGTTVPPGGSVLWSGTGITFGSPTSLTTTATVNAFGTFTATLTIKSDANQSPGCPDGVDTVNLTLSQNPTASAGADQSACEDTASHQFNLVGTGTVPTGATIQWSGAGITFGSPNALSTTATVSAFGSFTATLSISNPATGTDCLPASDTVVLVLNQNPVITIEDVACNAADGGTSIELEAVVSAGGGSVSTSYEWRKVGSATIIGTNATLTVTTPGTYTVTVKANNGAGIEVCDSVKSKNVGLCASDAAP